MSSISKELKRLQTDMVGYDKIDISLDSRPKLRATRKEGSTDNASIESANNNDPNRVPLLPVWGYGITNIEKPSNDVKDGAHVAEEAPAPREPFKEVPVKANKELAKKLPRIMRELITERADYNLDAEALIATSITLGAKTNDQDPPVVRTKRTSPIGSERTLTRRAAKEAHQNNNKHPRKETINPCESNIPNGNDESDGSTSSRSPVSDITENQEPMIINDSAYTDEQMTPQSSTHEDIATTCLSPVSESSVSGYESTGTLDTSHDSSGLQSSPMESEITRRLCIRDTSVTSSYRSEIDAESPQSQDIHQGMNRVPVIVEGSNTPTYCWTYFTTSLATVPPSPSPATESESEEENKENRAPSSDKRTSPTGRPSRAAAATAVNNIHKLVAEQNGPSFGDKPKEKEYVFGSAECTALIKSIREQLHTVSSDPKEWTYSSEDEHYRIAVTTGDILVEAFEKVSNTRATERTIRMLLAAEFRGIICLHHNNKLKETEERPCVCPHLRDNFISKSKFKLPAITGDFEHDVTSYKAFLDSNRANIEKMLEKNIRKQYEREGKDFDTAFPNVGLSIHDIPIKKVRKYYKDLENDMIREAVRCRQFPTIVIDWTGDYDLSKLPKIKFTEERVESELLKQYLKRTTKPSTLKSTAAMKCKRDADGKLKKCSEAHCVTGTFTKRDELTFMSGIGQTGMTQFPTPLTEAEHLTCQYIVECTQECKEHCDRCKCKGHQIEKGCQFMLALFRYHDKGFGVCSAEKIPGGKYVSNYAGTAVMYKEVVGKDESMWMNIGYNTNMVTTGDPASNLFRFFNHSCAPNMVVVQGLVERTNLEYTRSILFTRMAIDEGQEMVWSYITGEQTMQFPCRCGARQCFYKDRTYKKIDF